MQNFRDAVVILLGHGTGQNPDSCRPVMDHAEALAADNAFRNVLPAFWKQAPAIQEVLAGVHATKVFIVPMFVSEGYFSQEVIPEKLGFTSESGATWVRDEAGRRSFYTKPVGTHPSMGSIVRERASEVVRAFPFPRVPKPEETTLFIAGHGTGRNSNSRVSVERMADELRQSDRFAATHPVFMEEAPFIKDWRDLVQTKYAVVVPFFISEGLHVAEDIPVLLGEPETAVKQRLLQGRPTWRNPTEKHGVILWYAASVGTHPRIREIIRARINEAASLQKPEPV